MILNEVASSDLDLVLLLRNLVSQANSQEQPSFLSWAALNSLMQNINGEYFDYDSFKAVYDSPSTSGAALKDLVTRFSADGVELKTTNKTPDEPEQEKENTVSKMAKAATKRRIG
jgi:hypothetical protein